MTNLVENNEPIWGWGNDDGSNDDNTQWCWNPYHQIRSNYTE